MRNVVKPLKGKTMNQFVPKLFDVMKGYSKKQFVNDVIAGIIVAIIALPLSIALALASGATIERGLPCPETAGISIARAIWQMWDYCVLRIFWRRQNLSSLIIAIPYTR